jgi:hypothetical protein
MSDNPLTEFADEYAELIAVLNRRDAELAAAFNPL